MPHQLSVRVLRAEESHWGAVETRLLVDGVDVIARAFEKGPATDPDVLLDEAGPLADPPTAPVRVRLAEAECTVGCCGALEVQVHRDGDEVVWSGWHDPDADDVALGEFRFAAADYQAAFEQARTERAWDTPARTVARLVREALVADPSPLTRWDCHLDFAACPDARRPEMWVVFSSPPLTAATISEWTQYRVRVAVTEDPPADQARAAVGMLAAGDPRRWAEVCGGSR